MNVLKVFMEILNGALETSKHRLESTNDVAFFFFNAARRLRRWTLLEEKKRRKGKCMMSLNTSLAQNREHIWACNCRRTMANGQQGIFWTVQYVFFLMIHGTRRNYNVYYGHLGTNTINIYISAYFTVQHK